MLNTESKHVRIINEPSELNLARHSNTAKKDRNKKLSHNFGKHN